MIRNKSEKDIQIPLLVLASACLAPAHSSLLTPRINTTIFLVFHSFRYAPDV